MSCFLMLRNSFTKSSSSYLFKCVIFSSFYIFRIFNSVIFLEKFGNYLFFFSKIWTYTKNEINNPTF